MNYSTHNDNPINQPINLCEFEEALSKCSDSSPGPDEIPYSFLKNLSSEGNHYLLALFNRIFIERVFPTMWRGAIVLPLLKPNKLKTNMKSYRPISLTCTMCKSHYSFQF